MLHRQYYTVKCIFTLFLEQRASVSIGARSIVCKCVTTGDHSVLLQEVSLLRISLLTV